MSQTTFNEWRKNLSRTVNRQLGVSMNKMPDFPLQTWWQDGIAPRDAVEIIREELGAAGQLQDDDYSDYYY